MDINDFNNYKNLFNESLCVDESVNDLNTSLQTTKSSIVIHSQIDKNDIHLYKTRSGLSYNTSEGPNFIKGVNSSVSCSFTCDESHYLSKIIKSDTLAIVQNKFMPQISRINEEVVQNLKDDAPIAYGAEDKDEIHDSVESSPLRGMNTINLSSRTKPSENKYADHVIGKSNMIPSLSSNLENNKLINNNISNLFKSFSISEDQIPSSKETVSYTSAQSSSIKLTQIQQMYQRIKFITMKPNRKLNKLSKNLFTERPTVNSTYKCASEDSIFLIPKYPLRSRARLEKVQSRLRESIVGPKTVEILPFELYYRILQYLPIQDLFRIQRVNRSFKEAVENHLTTVKRINFNCGLPFAFLPDCITDSVLKRILSKTPEVTHILGFYPRKIENVPGISNTLTYSGIMISFRQCTKLKSVEIMDLELMSRVVHTFNQVKFHGMFRNRPYAWEDEYANPLLNKELNIGRSDIDCNNSTTRQLFKNNDLCQHSLFSKYRLCNKLVALKSFCNLVSMQQINSRILHINLINYGWSEFIEKMGYTPIDQGLPIFQPINREPFVNLVTPIPPSIEKLIIPTVINNLTKLDLMSVCIQHLPRLENIKFLLLKWVRFSSPDPFINFQAPKIQSFVMNNCIGPIRGRRCLRIFTALARSTQLNRLELVSTRAVEGFLENFFLDMDQGHLCFRNIQKLVLASHKEFGEVDVAALLLSSHASLNHLALSVSYSRNSLMLSLVNAKVIMQKLESIILGYQDPFQSILTGIEIHNLGLIDSSDHILPICKITDRGMAALMKLAPKLTSLHLRHAIYVEDPMVWLPKNWPCPIGNRPINMFENNEEAKDRVSNSFPLKSLTLENCPSIKLENISFILNHPATCFPQLEVLVLRDMFSSLPRCSVPQADIDSSIFNNWLTNTDRKQNLTSNSVTQNLNCRGRLVSLHSLNKDFRIKNQIIERLIERYCPLPPFAFPGGIHDPTHNSFSINNSNINSSSINVDDIIHNPNATQNRIPRFFIPPFTLNDIRFSNNGGDIFGMGSSGLTLYNAAGAHVLGAQHTNFGASIRQNEFLRPSVVINAMKSICIMHKLENLGLGRLVLWDGGNCNSNCKENEISFSNSFSDISEKQINSNKRKRSRSNDKIFNNQSVNGIYFHKSIVSKAKKFKKEPLKSDKPIKKHRINEQINNDYSFYPFNHEENNTYDFKSSSTQTCVCGYTDWHDASWQSNFISKCDGLLQPLEKNSQSTTQIPKPSNIQPTTSFKSSNINTSTANIQILDINLSDYECRLCSFPIDNFNNHSVISFSQPEFQLKHRPREWEAQDASVDTLSLRIYFKPQLYSLDLKQNTFAHLTILHLEKVGITHLILVSCHSLKSITLENCPELQAIIINSGTAPPSDSMPNLRRIRIMRCPKFAIYNLLYQVTRFYPQHDDNLYITYRPFGEYNPIVEKALWLNSDSHHVMVSHEYKQALSERNLEELCSSFDHLFQEMLNFSESLIRSDILTVSDFSRVNYFTNGSFLRSEHGIDWDLLTDIPWISEVCCSMLPSDLTRTQQADDLYELLSEIQSHLGYMKLCRRGIHFHVQFRDVHKPTIIEECSLINEVLSNDKQFSYLPCSYTDSYLQNKHPKDDINAYYCEPNIHDFYPELNIDHCDFNFISDISMFPSYLRDLLDDNSTDDITFGADINEKMPLPEQLLTDEILKSNISSFQHRNNNYTSFRLKQLEYKNRNKGCSSNVSKNRTNKFSIDFMNTKLRKFKSNYKNIEKIKSKRGQ